MTKAMALKIVNPILGVLIITQALSGFFHGALSYEAFEIIHEGGGALLILCVLVHVILNWNWIKANFLKKSPA